jgi:serine/threonine protein kinase
VLAQNRAANIDFSKEEYKTVGDDALDLLQLMLRRKPTERVTAEQALSHSFFNGMDIEETKLENVVEMVQ